MSREEILTPKAGDAHLDKLMSVSAEEFAQSWRAFDASPPPAPSRPARLALGLGHVTIAFEVLPPVTLGGLLALPRAVVSFTFTGCAPAEREGLLARFDRAFQRGGG